MMMSLGFFIFEIGTLPYQDLQRRTSWRHAATSRIGVRPAFQFLGDDDDSINIAGVIFPALTGDPGGLDTLRDMGRTGDAWPLVAGDGTVHGAFKLDSVQDGRREFFPDGTAREIEFSLVLFRVDDDQVLSADAAGGVGEDLDPIVDYDLDPAVTSPVAD
ncbi:MAG: phage tail protein [Phenylobacterium sp.]|nr:phage tail protein [Phenylobacterium sp.]